MDEEQATHSSEAPLEQCNFVAVYETAEAPCSREEQSSTVICSLIIFPWKWEIIFLDWGNLTVCAPKEKRQAINTVFDDSLECVSR